MNRSRSFDYDLIKEEDYMKFRDKVVIVTGSGKGIGKSIAQSFGGAGAKVIIAEKNEYLGKDVEENILKNGGESIFIKTDVSIPNDIINLVSEVDKMFGRIDILINNAGISKWNSPYSLEIEEWEYIINTNLRGVFLCSREVAKVMRKSGGAIVNISSTRAIMSEPNSEAYAASKGGIVSLTHALAASLSKDNIRVNCISPGWIEIEDYNNLTEIDHLQHLSGRVGRPEDIASACMFLTSDENSFINGTNIIIDGGMTKKMIYEH